MGMIIQFTSVRIFVFSAMACMVMTLLSSCASTYGEKGLRSFENDYGRSLPTSPRYKLEDISNGMYALTVHQGSPLISPGDVRAEYLSQAARVIAIDTCGRMQKEVVSSNIAQAGDRGWVHLQGTFTCGTRAVATTSPKQNQPKTANETLQTGTGFFVSRAGHIITSYHVIAQANEIGIIIEAGEFLPAKLIRADRANDLALLKTEYYSEPLSLLHTAELEKGAEVFTLGYPRLGVQGQEQKATFGRINSLSGLRGDIRLIQIDVPVQPGNSGGPLIDSTGNVVGVIAGTLNVFSTLSSSGSLPQNVNYAIKADYLAPLVDLVPAEDRNLQTKQQSEEKMSVLVRDAESSIVLVVAK